MITIVTLIALIALIALIVIIAPRIWICAFMAANHLPSSPVIGGPNV
jgi:hypothetical protein